LRAWVKPLRSQVKSTQARIGKSVARTGRAHPSKKLRDDLTRSSHGFPNSRQFCLKLKIFDQKLRESAGPRFGEPRPQPPTRPRKLTQAGPGTGFAAARRPSDVLVLQLVVNLTWPWSEIDNLPPRRTRPLADITGAQASSDVACTHVSTLAKQSPGSACRPVTSAQQPARKC